MTAAPRPVANCFGGGEVTLDELEAALRASWCALTAERPEKWTPESPAYLQCSATSQVVRGLLGGQILIAPVSHSGRPRGYHAWNRLPDGTEVDFTREQFCHGEELGVPAVREPARGFLAASLLRARVDRVLASSIRRASATG